MSVGSEDSQAAAGTATGWRARVSAWKYALNRRCAASLKRVIAWLDRNAERQGGGWGAHMEYKRRYTNPDDAMKARSPLPERRSRDRRS